jgi:hypothetical protein
MGFMVLLSVLFLAVPTTVSAEYVDLDQDGYSVADGDCDDYDEDTNPAATEIIGDGVDNDCDGMIDETKWYRDADADAYGDPSIWIESDTPQKYYIDNNRRRNP